ncbi:MAG: hypothetical protein HC890_02520 [Chloroflexaceae bacterium]|nr:hypothetical protein [Chloroflexaceae bacterium]
METSQKIVLKVSPRVAQAYQQATDSEKQSFTELVSLFFERDPEGETDFLGKLMDEISDRAVKRGLTPEILESILNEQST